MQAALDAAQQEVIVTSPPLIAGHQQQATCACEHLYCGSWDANASPKLNFSLCTWQASAAAKAAAEVGLVRVWPSVALCPCESRLYFLSF